jgi:hypothetical protein
VRNHELVPAQDGGGVTGPAYDTVARSLIPLPGGTTTLVLDAATLAVERQYRSLASTRLSAPGRWIHTNLITRAKGGAPISIQSFLCDFAGVISRLGRIW